MTHKLNFDSELQNFISETEQLSRVVEMIQYRGGYFLKKTGDFLKKEEGNDTISFIPKSKLEMEHDGFNDTKYRVKMKIGRFVNKFVNESGIRDWEITDRHIENFVNIYKSYFDSDENKLKVVEGDDILKYYLSDNYYNPNGSCSGTIWNSCMRYRQKNSFMRIYSENPNKIKMLVLFSEDGSVKTRALLWEDCRDIGGNKYKVMDRIYSVYDHDVLLFKKWALTNGYIHKYNQSAKSERMFVTNDGVKSISLTTDIDNCEFEFYPYIDTFKFFSKKCKTLSNCESFSYKYILIQNHGGLLPEESHDEEPDIELID